MTDQRHNRKERVGVVVSDKMDKTRAVRVERVYHHPMYHKKITASAKFKVHDENNSAKIGDTVKIQETRPLSKEKHFRLLEITKKSQISQVGIKEETPVENKPLQGDTK